MTRPVVALVAALGCVALLGSSASAEPQAASRVIDRTLTCTTQVRGGIRVLVAEAVAGVKRSSTPLVWAQLANTWATTGFSAPLAGVSAGVWTGVQGGWTLAFSSSLCRPTSASVALTSKGLTQEFVGTSRSQRRCLEPPRRVVVRVRAAFMRPAALRLDRQFELWRTAVPVVRGEIAVRTHAGRKLSYARVSDDGRARLFAAPTCYPD